MPIYLILIAASWIILISILYLRQLKHREVNKLTEGHIGNGRAKIQSRQLEYRAHTLKIFFWLCRISNALSGLSLVVLIRGYSSLLHAGSSLQWLPLWSTGTRHLGFRSCSTWAQQLCHTGSLVTAHRLRCSALCGIFPEQGWNQGPCMGRLILIHCTIREVWESTFLIKCYMVPTK